MKKFKKALALTSVIMSFSISAGADAKWWVYGAGVVIGILVAITLFDDDW